MIATRISYEVQYGKERSRREIAKRVVATYMAREYENHVFNCGKEARSDREFAEYILSGYENWHDWVRNIFTETQIAFMFSTPSEYKRNAKKPWFDIAANAAREALNEMLLPLFHKKDWVEPTYCFAR